MPKKPCLDGPSLIAYIATLQAGGADAAIEAHLARCRRCQALVAAARPSAPAALIAATRRIGTLLAQPRPDRIEPGQIWRLCQQEDGTYPLGVITRGSDISIDPAHPDVRMCRINLDATDDDLAADDVVVEAEESPLEMRFLIEHWNDRPAPAALLDRCLGRLAKPAWERLQAALADRHPAGPESPRVRAFRDRCIREAEPLSAASLGRALARASQDRVPARSSRSSRSSRDQTRARSSALIWRASLELADQSLPAAAAPRRPAGATSLQQELDEHRFQKLVQALQQWILDHPKAAPFGMRRVKAGYRLTLTNPAAALDLVLLGNQQEEVARLPFEDGVCLLPRTAVPSWQRVADIGLARRAGRGYDNRE